MKQYITRILEIDIGHRVLHERMKCFSLHGHRVKIELTFLFTDQADIGYCIDFKEIKRVGSQWIADKMDHGFIANPQDIPIIKACQETGSKYYVMSLNGENQYCNPTAENVSRELFMAIELLFAHYPNLRMHHLRYYETPNCWVDTYQDSLHPEERAHFHAYRFEEITQYAAAMGMMEYDTRKVIPPVV